MILHACCANADTIFQSYIYYYGLCSSTFDWTASDANLLNLSFWVSFMAGRFSGTPISAKVKPKILVFVYFLGSCIGVSIVIGLELAGNNSKVGLYAATAIFGYFVSCCYASSTSLCNGYTNMGLSYVYINNLGSSIGKI